MEYRNLGASGLRVPIVSLGTGTFGGSGMMKEWGEVGSADARRLVDICLDFGVNMFDSSDVYSDGAAEEILGAAIKGRRDKVILSIKASFRCGEGPNDLGSSRHHLIDACNVALKRLGVDHIDVFQLHCADTITPVEEVLATLDSLVRAGKVRYIGASNLSAWHLMKSFGVAERYGYTRYVVNQTYYSLVGRDYENELMPLGIDQGVGAAVWSPLGWARLTGKIRRGHPLPKQSRLHKTVEYGPPVEDELLFRVIDAAEEVAQETGRTIPQIALNWLLQRPTVCTVILGVRNEEQLRQNLGAIGWKLTTEQIRKLDAASSTTPAYPYWVQRMYPELSPMPVPESNSRLLGSERVVGQF
jgi:aryl-alcohol dehydrogenase-like predicted oxidoreductase